MDLTIGALRIVVEDDVLLCHANCPVTAAEMQQVLDQCKSIYDRFGSVYVVTVMGPHYDMPPDSRKVASAWARTHVMTCNIIVGVSRPMRVLLNLIVRAHTLLGGSSQALEFVDSEAEARRRIAEHKARLAGT